MARQAGASGYWTHRALTPIDQPRPLERHIAPEELEGFTECFLTGTAAEVTPVAEIGPYKFKPAQITETLMNDYAQDVHRPVSAVQL